MANAILTPSVIAPNALMHLENGLVLGKMVNTDVSSTFDGSVGDTVSVRRPVRAETQSDNLDVSSFATDVEDGSVSVSMNRTETTAFTLTPQELTLDIRSDRIQNIIQGHVIKLRDKVESDIAALYSSVWNYWGTPGTVPSTFLTLAQAGAHMTEMGIPMDPRHAVHNPMTNASLADSLKAVQVDRSKVTKALEKVRTGYYGGFDHYESVHMPKHTVGAYVGTPLVNGGSQNVTYATSKNTNTQSLITDGWTGSVTGILKAGDIITLAGVYSINPISKQSTGRLQTFVITTDADSSSGAATLTISPAIITSGPYQTVSAAPADNAAITVATGTASTTYSQSLLFHKSAFLMVTRPLNVTGGSGVTVSTKSGNNMSITCTETVDFNTLKRKFRFDVLYGLKAVYPDMALRLTS
jgi:hypothetical protein